MNGIKGHLAALQTLGNYMWNGEEKINRLTSFFAFNIWSDFLSVVNSVIVDICCFSSC